MNSNETTQTMFRNTLRNVVPDWAEADAKLMPTYEVDKVAERLNSILNTAANLRATAGQIADRIFGEEPCGTGNCKESLVRGGSLGRLNDACDQIEATLSDLAGGLSRIDRI